jgi:hypothetical protein
MHQLDELTLCPRLLSATFVSDSKASLRLVHQGTNMTALHYLAEKGDAHVMEILIKAMIKANADMNLRDSVSLLCAFVLRWMTHGAIKVSGSSNLMCDSVYAGGVRSLPQHCLDAAVLMFSFVVTCLALLGISLSLSRSLFLALALSLARSLSLSLSHACSLSLSLFLSLSLSLSAHVFTNKNYCQ